MERKTKIWIIVAVLIAAAGIIYFLARKKSVPIVIITVQPTNGYIAESVTATGKLQPVDTVSVGSQVSGLVKSIFADFNSVVKKGQLLAQIEPSIIKAQSEQSRANLANAKSNLQYQQINFDRQSKLFKLGAISQADYQLSTSQYQTAKAAVDNMQAQLKISLQTLSYTNIYSPIDGTVLNRNVSAGQTIASSFSAPTLFVIAKDLTKMQVKAAVDEADIGGVRTGQNVSFTVDAFPEETFRGTVKQILLHATTTSNVVTYTTQINVDNKSLKLRPGMTASINIYSQEDQNALLISARALVFKPDPILLKDYKIIGLKKNSISVENRKKKSDNSIDPSSVANNEKEASIQSLVWIKTGNTLTQKRITTGLNDGSNVKILGGLTTQDEVVTSATAKDSNAPQDATQKSPFMPTFGRKKTPNTTPKN